MKKHIGSTIAIGLGVLSLLAGIPNLSNTVTSRTDLFIAGIIMIMGALSYRSAKNRKLGIIKATALRISLEIAAICIIVAAVMVQSNLIYRIATHPVPNFIIPLWVVIAYIVISFKTSKKITAGLAILIVTFSTFMVLKADKPVIKTEKDMQYMIDSIDTKKGLDPKVPQNDFQQTMSSYMKELAELNTNTTGLANNIGPIEFSSFVELKDNQRVMTLKDNLKKYWYVRKFYYDKADTLLKEYRKKLEYGSENAGRLEGTATAALEKFEEDYVVSLTNFYDFVLQHHEGMIFTKDQIHIENVKLVNDLNELWKMAEESARNLTSFQEKYSKMMSDAIDALKKESNK